LPPTCRTRNVAWHVVPAAVSSRAMHESLDPVLDPVDVRTAILTRRVEGAGRRASRSRKKASTLWRTMWRTSSTRGETIRYIAPGKAVRRLVSAWSPAAQHADAPADPVWAPVVRNLQTSWHKPAVGRSCRRDRIVAVDVRSPRTTPHRDGQRATHRVPASDPPA
jgi:hypothetical protein